MSEKDTVYKHGSFKMDSADKPLFNRDTLLLSVIEKLKTDIEAHDPFDKRAQRIVNDLLYHYCWKMIKHNEKPV